jgi:hypothetical protein
MAYTLPRALLEVQIDGRTTFFVWVAAGRYVCLNDRATMAMAARGPIRELYFGFNIEQLFIRIDCARPAAQVLIDFDSLRLAFHEPADCEVLVTHPGRPDQVTAFLRRTEAASAGSVEVAVGSIVELAIPFSLLGVKPDQSIQFYVELLEGTQSRDRAPREGTIKLMAPSPDFERIMWDA